MSFSKSWTGNQQNSEKVLKLYRKRECLTVGQIAQMLGTPYHNVLHVLHQRMPTAEYKALVRIRKSNSKIGRKNPNYGKCQDQHPNWKGECSDGYGYTTIVHQGRRQFVHRVRMADALGLAKLPEHLDVHHIDGDGSNNDLDNLALCTRRGHQQVHYFQRKDSKIAALRKSTLREALQYMT